VLGRYTLSSALKSLISGRQLSTAPIQINHERKQWLDLQYGIMAVGDKNTMMRIAPFRQ
jgi:hypothetical protein